MFLLWTLSKFVMLWRCGIIFIIFGIGIIIVVTYEKVYYFL